MNSYSLVMIKAVLFDLDNTLIDFVKMKTVCSKASVKAMIQAGLEMKEDEAYKLLIDIYAPTFFEDDRIFEKFLKKAKGKIDYKILSAAIVAYRKIADDLLMPYEGVIETLNKLKNQGLTLGVVTDAPRIKGWIRLTTAGLSDYFNFVITLGDYKLRKPHKTPFNIALKNLNLKPEEVLFVGDNLEKDIKGDKKAGMKTAFAHYGHFLKEKPDNKDEEPDYTLKKFDDLARIVKKNEDKILNKFIHTST